MRLLVNTLVLLLLACGDDDSFVCPEGFEREGNGCVEASADSGPVDSSVDGGPDATSPCGDCTGDTPLCNETTSLCVQCLGPDNCTSMGVNTMCSDTGSCVECLGDSDCDGAGASVCATDGIMAGSCVACTVGNDDDCAGILGDEGQTLNVCDDSAGSGVCVECNAGDETACGDFVCDVLEQTCTDDVPVGMAPTCSPCVSDRQCSEGQACVPTMYNGDEAGHYCLWDLDAPEMAPPACPLPFGTLDPVTSISGRGTRSCQLGFSTCAAHNDFRTAGRAEMNCTGADTNEADADCGTPSLDDGFCVTNEATARDRCTVECGVPDDCVIDGACYGCPSVGPGETRVCNFTPVACP